MRTFIGTKLIRAQEMTRKAYNDLRGWDVPPDENPDDEGYLVEDLYAGIANTQQYKGYVSWSPNEVFEEAYRPVDGLTFGLAVEAMRKGLRVARQGWNGKGMYVWLMPGSTVQVGPSFTDPHLISIAEKHGGSVRFNDSIRMYCADGPVTTGWLASQTDITAEDWCIVD